MLEYILLSAACWAFTFILTQMEGPYGVLVKLRDSIINEKWSPIHCFICTSTWVSFVQALFLNYDFERFVLYWFAIIAGAVFLNQIFYHIDTQQVQSTRPKKFDIDAIHLEDKK